MRALRMAALAALLLLAGSTCAQQSDGTACPEGFTGPSCALCTSAAACAAGGGPGATCSTSLAFSAASTLKSYACSASGLAGSVLQPGSLLVQCSVPTANCSISFRVATSTPPLQVQCAATGCTFSPGSSDLQCTSTTCTCPGDATCGNSTTVLGLVGSVTGAASLSCNATGGCAVKLNGNPLISNIDATCEAAECLPAGAEVPATAPPAPGTAPSPSPPPDAPTGGEQTPSGVCPEDWEGHGCALCTTDYACTAVDAGTTGSAGNLAATCSRSYALASNSMLKSWSCDLTAESGFRNTIQGALVQCRTGLEPGKQLINSPLVPPPASEPAASEPAAPSPDALSPAPAATPPAAGPLADAIGDIVEASGRRRRLLAQLEREGEPLCQVSFTAVLGEQRAAVECQATDCVFAPGSSEVSCKQTACSCPASPDCGAASNPGSIDVGSLISAVKDVAIKCDDRGACTLSLGGLGVAPLGATCQAAECLVPVDRELTAVDPVQTDTQINTNPVIAAVPLMVLTLIAVVMGGYTWSQRSMWGYRISGADVAQLEALAAKPAALSHHLRELVFENLTVSVPLRPREAAKKGEALRRRALRRCVSNATAESLADMHSNGLARLLAVAKHKLKLPGGGDVEQNEPGSPIGGAEDCAAADFVVGLHQSPAAPDRWHILSGCSGTLRAGEVVGVLGPSGCGKTTYLAVLAGSLADLGSSAVVTGGVEVDGHRRRKSQVAYVPQSDVLIPSLTVQECLRYSALLRLPQDTSPLDLQVRVERVLDELGLRHIADAQVGGSGGIRGVSGGERRRVTIGMELVTDPSILVLDEPTSGLDSYTADSLTQTLKRVAAAGRVVVASLHQPSRDVFLSLDQVMLMGHGRVLYMGEPAKAEGWFERHGVPCPASTTIAEHMLRIAQDAPSIRLLLQSAEAEAAAGLAPQPGSPRPARAAAGHASPLGCSSGSTSDDTECGGEGEGTSLGGSGGDDAASLAIAKSPFADSPVSVDGLPPANAGKQGSAAAPLPAAGSHAAGGKHSRRRAGYGRQLSVMFWRTFTDIARNPALLLLHCVVGLAMGLLTGVVFFNLDTTNDGVQNRLGGTFFALAFLGFTSLTTVDLLITERQVVTREVRGGYYSPSAYLLSKLTLDAILLRVLPALLYFFPFYYMAGFKTGAAYAAVYCFTLVTFSCVVGAMSMSVTVASNTAGQASFAMNFLLLFSLVFTGFLVKVSTIPTWIQWVHYLSVFYYAFEAMVTSEINGMVFDFRATGSAKIPNVMGEVFLQTLGFDPEGTTRDIGVLVGLYFALVLVALALFYLRLPRGGGGAREGGRAAAVRRALSTGAAAVRRSASNCLQVRRVATTSSAREAEAPLASGQAPLAAGAAAVTVAGAQAAGADAPLRKRWWSNPVAEAPPGEAPHVAAPQQGAPPPSPLASGSARLAAASLPAPPADLQQQQHREQEGFKAGFKAALADARRSAHPPQQG